MGELVKLKPSDIDSQRMVVRVRQGKDKKDRYTGLTPQILDQLRDYWKCYRPERYLFEGMVPGRHISGSTVQKVFHKSRHRAGIQQCRTSALGGHVYACDQCGHIRISYISCRNSHCPCCEAGKCIPSFGYHLQELRPVPV